QQQQQQQQLQQQQLQQQYVQLSTPNGYYGMLGGGGMGGLDADSQAKIEQWRTNVVPTNHPHMMSSPSVASMHLSKHIIYPSGPEMPPASSYADLPITPMTDNFYRSPAHERQQDESLMFLPSDLGSPQPVFANSARNTYSSTGSSASVPSLTDSLSNQLYQQQLQQQPQQPQPQQQQFVVTVTTSPTIVPVQKGPQPTTTSSSSITIDVMDNGVWNPTGDNNTSNLTPAAAAAAAAATTAAAGTARNGRSDTSSAQINLGAGSAYASAAAAAVAAQQAAAFSVSSDTSSPSVRPVRTQQQQQQQQQRDESHNAGYGNGHASANVSKRILRPAYQGHSRSFSNGVSTSSASSSPMTLKPVNAGTSAGMNGNSAANGSTTTSHRIVAVSPTLSSSSGSTAPQSGRHHYDDNDALHHDERLGTPTQRTLYHHHQSSAQALPRQHVTRAPVLRPVHSSQELRAQQIEDPFGSPLNLSFEDQNGANPLDATLAHAGASENRYRSPQAVPPVPPRPPRDSALTGGFKVLVKGSGEEQQQEEGGGSQPQTTKKRIPPVVAPLNVRKLARQPTDGPASAPPLLSKPLELPDVSNDAASTSSLTNEKEEVSSATIMALLNASSTRKRSSADAIAAANAAANAANAAANVAAAATNRLRVRALQSAATSGSSLASTMSGATTNSAGLGGSGTSRAVRNQTSSSSFAPSATSSSGISSTQSSNQSISHLYNNGKLTNKTNNSPYASSDLKAEVVDEEESVLRPAQQQQYQYQHQHSGMMLGLDGGRSTPTPMAGQRTRMKRV
ncbi:hypothetical protein BGW42_004220, partial [Actinomortierella wolfii]